MVGPSRCSLLFSAGWLGIVLSTPVLFVGCGGGSASDQESGSTPKRVIASPGGIVRVTVTSDGTLLIEGESVSMEAFGRTLDEIGDVSEVRFFRESPRDDAAHERGLQALSKIESRQLPLAMYLDPEFEVRASDID